MIRTTIAAAAIAIVLAAPGFETAAQERFKSSVNLVALGVTVTGQGVLPRLTQDDFVVFEDGRPQQLRFFTADAVPLDLAILLDTSASMTHRVADVKAAAMELARALRPGDRASFTEVKRNMRTLQPLSTETTGLANKIEHTSPGGSTAIFDAIYVALQTLTHALPPGEPRRQALVILSDGDDTTSLLPFEEVVDAARRQGVTIYGVSLRVARPEVRVRGQRHAAVYDPSRTDGDHVLRSLARHTGGQAYFNVARSGLAAACREIADELSKQYVLGYVSDNSRADGRFRSVAVRVLSPDDARARTRQGYFAPAPGERVASSTAPFPPAGMPVTTKAP